MSLIKIVDFRCPLKNSRESKIVDCANKNGVKVFAKSACAASDISGDVCFAHIDEQEPINLDFVKRFYDLEVDNEQIVLINGTPGDCNFVRFITHKRTVLRDGDCWYCSAEYVFPECKEPTQIGCNPVEIFDYSFAVPIGNC